MVEIDREGEVGGSGGVSFWDSDGSSESESDLDFGFWFRSGSDDGSRSD